MKNDISIIRIVRVYFCSNIPKISATQNKIAAVGKFKKNK
jgi:hypothetical protein